jgi:hypothetical protein
MAESTRTPVNDAGHDRLDEPPPLLGTWRRLYFAVIAWLALLIIVFYLFAWRFAP